LLFGLREIQGIENMGNGQSGAQVSVQLNQDGGLICGGSKLSGTVYLNVEKDSITADSLNVKFYGHEATQVQYQESYVGSDGKSNRRTVTVRELHQLVCVDYVLCKNYTNSVVLKGRYEYPFEITLPDFLPGKQGQKYGGNWFVIEYFLEARLHRSGMLTFDVKNSQEILLSDKPFESIEKTPSFIEPICRPVYFFCCYKTGTKIHIYTCIYIYIYIYVCINVYVYTYIYINIHICMCIYICILRYDDSTC
jgi:hypothetical protein